MRFDHSKPGPYGVPGRIPLPSAGASSGLSLSIADASGGHN